MIAFYQFLTTYVGKKFINRLIKLGVVLGGGLALLYFIYLILSGESKWSGRSMTLLDPTYARKYIPIIASVSEHQATTWASFFFDLHYLMVFTPIGLWYCSKNPNQGKIFVIMYVVLAVYFASVMVRLLLVLGPATCICGGIGVSALFRIFTKAIRTGLIGEDFEKAYKKRRTPKNRIPADISIIGLVLLGFFMSTYIFHSHFSGAEAYSNPSIILSSKDR